MSGPPPDYIDVAERIREFREAHPDGSLCPADPAKPYSIETIGDKTFVVVVSAAYRSPDDPRPGVGMAWEPFPGPTNFTRDSELQNCETSSWGRAIVAALAGDSKRVASANEVVNRQANPSPSDAGKLRHIENLYRQLPEGTTAKTLDTMLTYAKQSDGNADATITKLETELEAVGTQDHASSEAPAEAPF